jgi:regulatory protein
VSAPHEVIERALADALRYLNRRERTVAEIRRHLRAHGTADEAIEAVVERLAEQGYLDDARYARLFAEDKRSLEQWGSERIRQALLERGVDRELVERAVSDRPWPGELEQALSLLKRRFAVAPLERRERDRALGLLLRRGYDPELALDALAAYGRESSSQ